MQTRGDGGSNSGGRGLGLRAGVECIGQEVQHDLVDLGRITRHRPQGIEGRLQSDTLRLVSAHPRTRRAVLWIPSFKSISARSDSSRRAKLRAAKGPSTFRGCSTAAGPFQSLSAPGILMWLLPAKRTYCDSACAIEESRFQRRSHESGNLVVNSACRDLAEGLCQFDGRSGPRAAEAERRRAACVFFHTRKRTRVICGSCTSCEKAR